MHRVTMYVRGGRNPTAPPLYPTRVGGTVHAIRKGVLTGDNILEATKQ